jgi:hypothetical protein
MELVCSVPYKLTLYCVIHESLRLMRGRNEINIRPSCTDIRIPVFVCRAITVGNSTPTVVIKRASPSDVHSKLKDTALHVTSREGIKGKYRYSSILSSTSAVDGVECQHNALPFYLSETTGAH